MAFFCPSNNDVDMMATERRMDNGPDAKGGVWKAGPSSSLGDPPGPSVAPVGLAASRCPSRLPTSSSSSPSSSSPSCSRRSSTGSDDSGGDDDPSPPRPRSDKPAHRVNVKLKPKFRPQFPFLVGQHAGQQDDGTTTAPSVPSLSLDGGGVGPCPPRLAPASLLFPSPPTAPRPDAAAAAAERAAIPLRGDDGGDLMEARGRLFRDADDVLRNLSSMAPPGLQHESVRPDAGKGTDAADRNCEGRPSLACGGDDAVRRKSSCARGFGSLLRGTSNSSDETWNLDDCVEETDEAFAMAIEDLRQHNGGGQGGLGDADPSCGGHIAFPALSSPPPGGGGGAGCGRGGVVVPPALDPDGGVFTPSPSSARTPEHAGLGGGRPPPVVHRPAQGLDPRRPIPPRFPAPCSAEEEKEGGPAPPPDLRAMPFLDAPSADDRTPSPPPRLPAPGRNHHQFLRRQSSASSAMSIEEVSAAIEAAARVIGATTGGVGGGGGRPPPPPPVPREIEQGRAEVRDGTSKLSCREKRRAFAFGKSSTSQQAMEDVISKAFEQDYHEGPQGLEDPSSTSGLPGGSGSFCVRPLRQALERSISNLSDHRFTIDEDEEVFVGHGHDHHYARHSCPCGPAAAIPPPRAVRERNLSHPKQLLERSISTLSESNFRTPVQSSDSSTSASAAAEAKHDEKMDDDHEDPFAPMRTDDDDDEEKAEGDAIMAARRRGSGEGGSGRISWGSVSTRSSGSSGNGPRSVWKNNSLLRTSSKTFARIEEQVADQRRHLQQQQQQHQQHPPPPIHPQSQPRSRDHLPPPASQPLPPCLFLESATSVVEPVAAEAMAPPPPRLLRPPVRVQRNTSHPRHLLERSISSLSESNFRTPVHDGGLGDALGAAGAVATHFDEKVNDEEYQRDPFGDDHPMMGAEEEARLHEEAEAVRRRSSAGSVNGPRSVWKNNSLLRTSSKTFVRFEEDFRRQVEEEDGGGGQHHQVQVQVQLPPELLAPPRRALMRSISNLSERNFHTPGGGGVDGGAALADHCPPPPQRRLPDEDVASSSLQAGDGGERVPPSRNDSLLMLPRLSGLSGSSESFFGGGAPGEATFGGGEGGAGSAWSDDASATDFLRVPC